MANAGRVAIVPKGDWDLSEAYKRLDAVTYNNILYIAKKVVPKNTAVTNTDYWMPSVAGGVAVKATTTNIGQVQPDGETIEVDADGKISAKTALDTKPTIIATAEPNIVDTVEAPMLVTNATKNLLKSTLQTTTQNGVTCTNNGDGTYTLNGTSTIDGYTFFDLGFYMTGIEAYGLTLIGDKNSDYGHNSYGIYWDASAGSTNVSSGWVEGKSTKIPEITNGANVNVGFFIAIGGKRTADDVVFKPMLTTDLSATYDDFVPYDGYEIKSCGKNLLKPISPQTLSANGVNVVINSNFTITVTGTSSSDTWVSLINKNLSYLDPGTYKFVCEAMSNISVALYTTNGIRSIGHNETFTINERVKYDFGFSTHTQTFDNTIHPMITRDLTATVSDYEPYQESTVQITPSTEFPLLGLKSFDGETNIISPGNVEVAFAKNDSGKAILGMCKPTVKNLVSTVEGNPLDATMGAQLKKEIDELKAKVDAMSTSTTTE